MRLKRNNPLNKVPVAAGTILFFFSSISRAQGPSEDPLQFFESKVRPILATQCYGCHSSKSKVASGGLRLDSKADFFQGGHSGPPVVPGKPGESKLIQVIEYASDLKMPPQGKLKPEQIETLTRWVRSGAAWPDEAVDPKITAAAEARKKADAAKLNHWAWKGPAKPAVPNPQGVAWAETDIDRFIFAKLEEKHLAPVRDADPRTLLRRVYFDLTGLPPTPAQVNSFASDPSRAALEQVVDRLLASPEFGERWGRHWLDE